MEIPSETRAEIKTLIRQLFEKYISQSVKILDDANLPEMVDEAQTGLTHLENAIDQATEAVFEIFSYVTTFPEGKTIPKEEMVGDCMNTMNTLSVIQVTVMQEIISKVFSGM